MKVIAIDYDDTLCMKDDVPNKEVIRYVNRTYRSRGNLIMVHTARPESHRKTIAEWLKVNRVLYHAIVCDKLPADMYIDDKAILPAEVGEKHE